MTQKKWFLNLNSLVTGPFDQQEIENELKKNPAALVWARGFSEWFSGAELPSKLLEHEQKNQSIQTQVAWKYKIHGLEFGPFSMKDLILELKKLAQVSPVELWNDADKHWKEIFAVEAVADQLGLSRRSHPRVPIMGSFEGEGPDGNFKHIVVTISQGGLGLGETFKFKLGDLLKGTLVSPNLFISVHCSCEVVYVGQDGYVGLRFTGLPSEAQSAVIEYVNRFEAAINETQK